MKLICNYLRDHVLQAGEKITSAWAHHSTNSVEPTPETGFLVELTRDFASIQLSVLPTKDRSWVFGQPRIVGGDLGRKTFDDLVRRLAGHYDTYFFDLGAALRQEQDNR